MTICVQLAALALPRKAIIELHYEGDHRHIEDFARVQYLCFWTNVRSSCARSGDLLCARVRSLKLAENRVSTVERLSSWRYRAGVGARGKAHSSSQGRILLKTFLTFRGWPVRRSYRVGNRVHVSLVGRTRRRRAKRLVVTLDEWVTETKRHAMPVRAYLRGYAARVRRDIRSTRSVAS